jgi:uncharacterized membrane protein
MMLLSFLLLLPFFALLVWLALISKPAQRDRIAALTLLSLVLSAFASAVGFDVTRNALHPMWPYLVAALLAFGVYLSVFALGFLRLPASGAHASARSEDKP